MSDDPKTGGCPGQPTAAGGLFGRYGEVSDLYRRYLPLALAAVTEEPSAFSALSQSGLPGSTCHLPSFSPH